MWQLCAGSAAAVITAPMFGFHQGLGVFSGTVSVALGSAVFAWLTLGGGIRSATSIFRSMMLGMVLRWGVIVALLYVAIALLKFDGLAVIAGVGLALLALPLAHFVKTLKGEQ